VSAFWAAMQANDWHKAATYLAPEYVIDWPCSGERIAGRSDFASIQARYPTNTGRWSFDVAFSELAGAQIARQIEYWPASYDPLPGREDLTRRIDRVP